MTVALLYLLGTIAGLSIALGMQAWAFFGTWRAAFVDFLIALICGVTAFVVWLRAA